MHCLSSWWKEISLSHC